MAKPRPAASDSVQQLPLLLEGGESSTIFVVDDDRAIREAMRDLLSENGYAVELFADGPGLPRRPIVQAAKDAFWSMR